MKERHGKRQRGASATVWLFRSGVLLLLAWNVRLEIELSDLHAQIIRVDANAGTDSHDKKTIADLEARVDEIESALTRHAPSPRK